MGKDWATISNTLRLLKLAEAVQGELAEGRLTWGHARPLLALESPRAQVTLAQRIISRGLSVRQVERLVRTMTEDGQPRRRSRQRDPHVAAAEEKIQRSLGTNVQILHGRKRGWVRIAYYSLKDLDRLIHRLCG